MDTGKDKYIVTDLATDGEDYVTFSWELSRKVTAYKGIISFIVCAIKTNSDGTITNEWNTTLANYNNQNAPSAIDEKSRMMVKVGEDTGQPSIVINNIIGSFRGCDDYFDYPTTNIRYIRVDNISFERNDVKFGRKFRSSYIDPYLYKIF